MKVVFRAFLYDRLNKAPIPVIIQRGNIDSTEIMYFEAVDVAYCNVDIDLVDRPFFVLYF